MIDPFVIGFITVFAGAVVAVVVPYLLKVRETAAVFDYSYFVAMIVAIIIAAVALVPDTVVVTAQSLLLLFVAGCGIQWAANTVNTQRIKMLKS